MSKILVIGSISVDNVTYTSVMPKPGMTVFGEAFISNIGGKGANQACAATFLGADVTFYGCLGKDDNGVRAKSFLKQQELKMIIKESEKQTGIASIVVDNKKAENQIVIVPGSNLDINTKDIDSIKDLIKESDILLIQLENPVETVCYAIQMAKESGLITILNPAPYHELPKSVYKYIDFFVPNEHELDDFVSGELTYEEKCREIVKLGAKNVIVTLGEKGSLLVNEKEVTKVASHHVEAVDTTGAGDSYLGAFVTALSQKKNIKECMEFASLASSKTVTKKGAILSLPKLEELQ